MSNRSSISYRQVGDYITPNLTLSPKEANTKLGKWGMLHKDDHLKHRKTVFATQLVEGKLWQYLAQIDIQAQEMFDTLAEQLKEAEDVTEQLKARDQMEWFSRMNDIRVRATEIVNRELIFV